jgi:predicted metalloprotease with PDZ domain
MAHLVVTLAPVSAGIQVTWHLDGVAADAGDPLAQLPLSIAGAPTLRLGDDAVAATDHRGHLPLVTSLLEDDDGDRIQVWSAARATVGRVSLSYLAEPAADEPRPATPPLELRAEGGGFSGALKCFLVLPPGPEDATFELRWTGGGDRRLVSSLGELDGDDGVLTGTGLELLGDTYLMGGDLTDRHHRDGALSTWWLTAPGIDLDAFGARLGATYRLMSTTFDVPAHPYRVFLRTHPHRGVNGSAHPASFVMALNPEDPLDTAPLYETLAHELVHEWLRLDGPVEDVTWFVEGSADYYSLVLPRRAGMLDEDAFLEAVNFEARECWANPRRDLTVREAQQLFFTDFLAHRLPYARGMFYLADLDARIRRATTGRQSVDDVVREVVRRRGSGERIGLQQWCALVEDLVSVAEMPRLEAMVFTGVGGPGEDCFGSGFVHETVEVPVLDLGWDPSTFVTRRVTGLRPGGVAAEAGLREGEVLDLSRYPEIVRLDVGDVLDVGVIRNGEPARLALPLGGTVAPVPQWRSTSTRTQEQPQP